MKFRGIQLAAITMILLTELVCVLSHCSVFTGIALKWLRKEPACFTFLSCAFIIGLSIEHTT